MIILDGVNVIMKSVKPDKIIFEILTNAGLDPKLINETFEKIRPYEYGGLFTTKNYYRSWFAEKRHVNRVYGLLFDELDIKDPQLRKKCISSSLYYKNRYVAPSTYETLQKMKRLDKMVLCTNAHPSMKKTLRQLKLTKYFKYIYISGLHKIDKPNTKVYKYLLKKGKCNEVSCFYLDDYLDNVLAAKKLGIKSYLMIKSNSDEQIKDIERCKDDIQKVQSLEEFYEEIKKFY